MNVMLDEPGILTAVQGDAVACTEFWWGKRLRAVQVSLAHAEASGLAELVADAWERRAPKRLLPGPRSPRSTPGIGSR
jgi:hypothetical protein